MFGCSHIPLAHFKAFEGGFPPQSN